MEPSTPSTPQAPAESRRFGPILGAVALIALIVIAALYFWGERIVRTQGAETEAPASGEAAVASEQE